MSGYYLKNLVNSIPKRIIKLINFLVNSYKFYGDMEMSPYTLPHRLSSKNTEFYYDRLKLITILKRELSILFLVSCLVLASIPSAACKTTAPTVYTTGFDDNFIENNVFNGASKAAVSQMYLNDYSSDHSPSDNRYTTNKRSNKVANTHKSKKHPIALVYRGSAGCSGCSEAVAALLKSDTKHNFNVIYVGPKEQVSVGDGLKLKNVVLYAQPGGDGSAEQAYSSLSSDVSAVRNFVQNGGRYLGFCMGGYLVDDDPGYGLGLNTDQYIASAHATVTSEKDSIVQVSWRGNTRFMYFQDGPYFTPDSSVTGQTILAYYTNGKVAAMVQPFGKGKIGVSGLHPEADAFWYSEADLEDPDGLDSDLGLDLIHTLMH
jgi:glutamine amidotransferase-like uncharacterized protein